jgi:hypothetical protein
LLWPLWPLGAPFDACCVAIVSMCCRDSANGCFGTRARIQTKVSRRVGRGQYQAGCRQWRLLRP